MVVKHGTTIQCSIASVTFIWFLRLLFGGLYMLLSWMFCYYFSREIFLTDFSKGFCKIKHLQEKWCTVCGAMLFFNIYFSPSVIFAFRSILETMMIIFFFVSKNSYVYKEIKISKAWLFFSVNTTLSLATSFGYPTLVLQGVCSKLFLFGWFQVSKFT